MLQHADDVGSSKIDEGIEVPSCFLEAANVYRFQRSWSANTDFIWAKSYSWPMLLMEGIYGTSTCTGSSLRGHP